MGHESRQSDVTERGSEAVAVTSSFGPSGVTSQLLLTVLYLPFRSTIHIDEHAPQNQYTKSC